MSKMKQMAATISLPLVFSGCAYVPDKVANRTPQEQRCHEMASDGNFRELAQRSLYGAAAGAAVGAVAPNVSWGQGAGVGAAATAITTFIQQESEYRKAFNDCMQNTQEWMQEYNEYEKFKMQQQQLPQRNPDTAIPPVRTIPQFSR